MLATTLSRDNMGLNLVIGRERPTRDRMSRPNILVVSVQLYNCRPTYSSSIKLRFTAVDNKITDN